jgi:hypothetical protein
MKRMDVVKKGKKWVAKTKKRTVATAPKKADIVKKAAAHAKRQPKAVSLRIHKANGRFQEERTYPGKADRRRSKG